VWTGSRGGFQKFPTSIESVSIGVSVYGEEKKARGNWPDLTYFEVGPKLETTLSSVSCQLPKLDVKVRSTNPALRSNALQPNRMPVSKQIPSWTSKIQFQLDVTAGRQKASLPYINDAIELDRADEFGQLKSDSSESHAPRPENVALQV
jgi:hypothetical protein